DAAVDRIVPLQHHDDPLMVTVEPFHEWVVDGSSLLEGFPVIEGMHLVSHLEPYIERKLFTVNTGHCCAAYHGYLRGYATIQQAMKDEAVQSEVRNTLQETGAMLIRKYGFDEQEHMDYISSIMARFINPYLMDEVVRVGRSPVRKLSPDDRLIRPALAAHALGLEVAHLARAAAAALRFNYKEDPEAVQLQESLARYGLHPTITTYTGIPETHFVHQEIARHYEALN
ncbi:mannitol-1-phosphate 5-dehydrogenase, partial [Paenibacillus sepulcri]|nr:mannitol-1-phosphate 5-dehydrogenase [Paenibacillus sepulcri]